MKKEDIDRELTSFGEFLLKRSLVQSGREKFYVLWLRRYFNERERLNGQNWEEKLALFMDLLGIDPRYAPWQVNQAEDAIRLYFQNYRAPQPDTPPPFPKDDLQNEERWIVADLALDQLSKLLGLKHYAFKTEQTYIGWCKRLFSYSIQYYGQKEQKRILVSPAVITDFLARIATREKVSKSTQNQAFSAFLFLCRNVLDLDLSGMEKNVRVRRGKRLPVVLSPAEIKTIFSYLSGTSGLILRLIYSGGLRLSECTKLRVKDLDFDQDLLFIRSGKGDKDRATLFAKQLQTDILLHLERVKGRHRKDLEEGYGESMDARCSGPQVPFCMQGVGLAVYFPQCQVVCGSTEQENQETPCK